MVATVVVVMVVVMVFVIVVKIVATVSRPIAVNHTSALIAQVDALIAQADAQMVTVVVVLSSLKKPLLQKQLLKLLQLLLKPDIGFLQFVRICPEIQ